MFSSSAGDEVHKRALSLTILRALLGIWFTIYILSFFWTVLVRLTDPFALEWIGGTMLEGVRLVAEGKPLYTAPTSGFTSFLFPPLYYLVSAGVSKLLGTGFLPLRLVSLLSSLGTALLLGKI